MACCVSPWLRRRVIVQSLMVRAFHTSVAYQQKEKLISLQYLFISDVILMLLLAR